MNQIASDSHLLLAERKVRVAEGDAPNSFGKMGGNQWAALCAAHNSVSEKPLSSILVPEVGLEPTSLTAADFKSTAYTNSATRAYIIYYVFSYLINEASAGIEPAYKSFADSCLTTWPRRPIPTYFSLQFF